MDPTKCTIQGESWISIKSVAWFEKQWMNLVASCERYFSGWTFYDDPINNDIEVLGEVRAWVDPLICDIPQALHIFSNAWTFAF
jgi:hypothetical protein